MSVLLRGVPQVICICNMQNATNNTESCQHSWCAMVVIASPLAEVLTSLVLVFAVNICKYFSLLTENMKTLTREQRIPPEWVGGVKPWFQSRHLLNPAHQTPEWTRRGQPKRRASTSHTALVIRSYREKIIKNGKQFSQLNIPRSLLFWWRLATCKQRLPQTQTGP